MRTMPQQPRAAPEIRIGHLAVVFETGVPCIVEDDDTENPIRMVNVGGRTESVLADELVVVDRELFEMAIVATKRGWVV